MPIVSHTVTDGPNRQRDGSCRGVVSMVFGDGRVMTRSIRAASEVAWPTALAALITAAAEAQQLRDAQADISPITDIAAHGEASVAQRAVAYLRKAWQTEQAYDAYLLFDRFNTYRTAQGWTLNQVQSQLASAGLGAEEWEAMKTQYQYLAAAGRPAIMSSARAIQAAWEVRP